MTHRQPARHRPPTAAARATCGGTSPGRAPGRQGVPTIVRGEGHHIWDDPGRRYIDGLSGLFVVQAGHGRTELAEAGRRAGRASSRSSRCGPTRTRRRSTSPSGWRRYAPGDLNRVFFTTGGGEAVETAWKLAQAVLEAHRQAEQAQGDLPVHRLPRHHARRAVDHRPARGSRQPFEPLVPGRAQGAEHQRVPGARAPARRPEGVRALGRGPRSARPSSWRARTPSRRCSSSPCRTPAAASRRRPATSSGSGRSATEYDVLLVSDEVDLRVRPDRRDLRVRRPRLRART